MRLAAETEEVARQLSRADEREACLRIAREWRDLAGATESTEPRAATGRR
jgi:hypothetical protein